MSGFEGREFLHEYEWLTYLKRMPVRYIKRKHSETCDVCGGSETEGNTFEHSHRIPFSVGVKVFGLTPDYLDDSQNIVTAHRRTCNKSAEMTILEITEYLHSKGLQIPEYLTTSKKHDTSASNNLI